MSSALIAILAAGESRRMGQPKLCMRWGKMSILGHLIQQWHEAGAKKILVIHAQEKNTPVVLELERLGIPLDQRTPTVGPERGMMGSIVTAARRVTLDPSLTHLIIALGDQPHLQTETLRQVLRTSEANPEKIVRTVYQGKPGHPLALPASLTTELATTSTATLRDFISLHMERVLDLTCSDSGVLLDIDTPDDYEQVSRRAAQ